MGIVEAATGTWNLKCHSPYPVHSIQSIHMERKAGGHARLFLTAVLPEEQQDREIDMTTNGENISLIETGERGQEIRKLFQGIIQEVGVRDVQGYTSWNWRLFPIRICWTSSHEFVRFSIARWNVRT